jgi:hypothetical protein
LTGLPSKVNDKADNRENDYYGQDRMNERKKIDELHINIPENRE